MPTQKTMSWCLSQQISALLSETELVNVNVNDKAKPLSILLCFNSVLAMLMATALACPHTLWRRWVRRSPLLGFPSLVWLSLRDAGRRPSALLGWSTSLGFSVETESAEYVFEMGSLLECVVPCRAGPGSPFFFGCPPTDGSMGG